MTNTLLEREPNNANIQDDADFFSSVTKLGASGATTNADLVVQGDKDHDKATLPSTVAVEAVVSPITTMASTTYMVMEIDIFTFSKES